MIFLKIYRFLFGYVRFSVSGDFPERLLNIFAVNGIASWNVVRKSGTIEASVMAKNYLKMRSLRGDSGTRTRITGKHGLPFFMRRYRRRAGFAVGMALCLAALKILSMFVWNVEVSGNSRIPDETVLAACRELGIREGVKISSIDTENAGARLAIMLDDAAWTAINIEGVKVTVDITETREVPERDDDLPCNIKADCDAQITAIEVTEGKTLVKTGDVVTKGQLLVSGVTEFADGSSGFVRAAGRITGRTNCEITCFEPFSGSSTVKTGETVRRSVLCFFGINIPLYLGSVRGDYEKRTSVSRFERDGMYLPIYFKTAIFEKQRSIEHTLNEETAAVAALEKLRKKAETELSDAVILSSEETTEAVSGGVLARGVYACEKNIAKQEILSINATNR